MLTWIHVRCFGKLDVLGEQQCTRAHVHRACASTWSIHHSKSKSESWYSTFCRVGASDRTHPSSSQPHIEPVTTVNFFQRGCPVKIFGNANNRSRDHSQETNTIAAPSRCIQYSALDWKPSSLSS
eukprot:776314-Prorocentrum_minimum.AAC.6